MFAQYQMYPCTLPPLTSSIPNNTSRPPNTHGRSGREGSGSAPVRRCSPVDGAAGIEGRTAEAAVTQHGLVTLRRGKEFQDLEMTLINIIAFC